MNLGEKIAAVCFAALFCGTAAHGQNKVQVIKPKQTTATPAEQAAASSEPDKVLYERSMLDLKKKRYEEERLSLDVLINTYPDSEYLAKAKLAKADSYYSEGGVSNMMQAIGEYKSYIVFFPFDENAPYAQMQIGNAHMKMMEKADRDTSEALSAEGELQTFLLKYPDSKYAPAAAQRLRNVQEVIADGQYRVARFYYLRPDYRAAAARLVDLTQRYPLYSQSDEALWMLSDIYATMKKFSRNEDDKNHWGDLEGQVLNQIVVNYPLSARAAQARSLLKGMGMDVPEADPAAVERMKKQAVYVKTHHQNSMMHAPMGLLKSGPDYSTAAQSGRPNLDPPDNSITARDILMPKAAGPQFNLSASVAGSSYDAPTGGASDPIASGDTTVTSIDAGKITGTVGTITTASSSTTPDAQGGSSSGPSGDPS